MRVGFMGTFVVVAGLGLGAVYLRFGTVEPCGILRQQTREEASKRPDSFPGPVLLKNRFVGVSRSGA